MRLVEVHTESLAAAAAELVRASTWLPRSAADLHAATTGDRVLDEAVTELVDAARRSARGLAVDIYWAAGALLDAAAVYELTELSMTP